MSKEAAEARAARYTGREHLEVRVLRRGAGYVVELKRRAGGGWFVAPRS